MKTEQHRK